MNAKVSIIIPCFNDGAFVTQAVNSALNQTYGNKEVILIDDGSDEDTKEILKKLEPKITKLITQQNSGAGAARNNGITNCTGEFILNHDSDDFFDPTFCEKAVNIFQDSKVIKIVTCDLERFNKKGTIDVLKLASGSLKDFLKSNKALGSSMFLKEDWSRLGGYDESRILNGYEDWEFYIRLLKDGGISYVIPEKLFYYRIKKVSNSSQANSRKYEILKYLYFKHSAIYIENFELFIDHLLKRMEIAENSERKSRKKIDFKIGQVVLFPLRKLKQIFKSNEKS
jgi:hypothetical protein